LPIQIFFNTYCAITAQGDRYCILFLYLLFVICYLFFVGGWWLVVICSRFAVKGQTPNNKIITKQETTNNAQQTGKREQGTGNREQERGEL